MKKNLISAIAGWKSAALLALVAMVAAVAFSGVLTSTETADAQGSGTADDPYIAVPGQTITATFDTGTQDRYRISTDSEGSAVFTFNGGQALRCADGAANGCDTDADANEIGLQITIDEDTPIGEVYVQRIARAADGTVTVSQERIIQINRPNPVAAIKAANRVTSAIPKDTPATGGGALIVVQVVNAGGAGIDGAPLQITTTRGGLSTAAAVVGVVGDATQDPPVAAVRTRTANAAAPGTTCPVATDGLAGNAACTLLATSAGTGTDATAGTTDDELGGMVAVVLKGNGGTGTAEVVFRHPVSGHSHTVNVVLHGPAASVSASVDQSTIGIGNSTFIVVSVSDADGNPVPNVADVNLENHKPLVPAIVGPEVPAGSTANLVSTALNVNRDLPGVVNDLPSCAAHDTAATDDTPASSSTGTSLGGKCVIQVTASAGGPGPADDATRGTHSLTVGITSGPRIAPATVEVQVGGSPASIETDAPARVDSLSTTSISITVLDDEGVRVGAVPISVVKVEGSGNVDDVPGGMTSDGRGSFTYLAPLTPGEAVFLIRAGAPGQVIQDTITLAIGPEPVVEEAPEAPPATWNNDLVSGQNLVVWNGADGADPSEGAADGVSAIWAYNTGSGSWDGYFPDAADVPGGNTLTSLGNGQAYVVIVD